MNRNLSNSRTLFWVVLQKSLNNVPQEEGVPLLTVTERTGSPAITAMTYLAVYLVFILRIERGAAIQCEEQRNSYLW